MKDSVNRKLSGEYKLGFETKVESETFPAGLDIDVIKKISSNKGEPEWLLNFRLKAYNRWISQVEPTWANIQHGKIDYQKISYFSRPKTKLDSLDQVDESILRTYERLGIPLEEQKLLAGVAIDAVFDSVSVITTFYEHLKEKGIIFCSISEAAKNHLNY